MHLSIIVLCLGVAVATAENHFLSDDYINKINSAQKTWTAGRNFDENTPKSEIRALLGVKKGYKTSLKKKDVEIVKDLPDNFDARENWSQCSTIKEISDQSTCGSCWAVAAVNAMSDRMCIKNNVQISLSANDLLACCGYCGDGCNGGDPGRAWTYWEIDGIASGGGYGSNEGCQTYVFPPCEHHNAQGSRPPCGPSQRTPACTGKCDENSTLEYRHDIHFGDTTYSLSSDVEKIKSEIYTNGPVEATFDVYDDFVSYKKGVYQRTSDKYLGGHAVRVLGWGVENDIPYWLVANSWNDDWGDKGLFKIRLGKNECGFEDNIDAGIPLY